MQIKGWAVTMGLGVAAGAVAVMMLPKQSAPRKMATKAAEAVEDTAKQMTDKMAARMEM